MPEEQFDLEQHIGSWRTSMAAALAGRADAGDVIDELETHLRDEVARLTAAGQAPQRAWDSAVARLGDARRLADEFNKVVPAATSAAAAARWLPARVVQLAWAAAMIAFAVFVAARWRRGNGSPLLAWHVVTVTIGYSAAFAVGTLAAVAVIARAVGAWDARRAAAARSVGAEIAALGLPLSALGVALGGWWAYGAWGRFWNWDAREVGGLLVLAWWGVWFYWGRRPGAGRLALLLGLLGNVVVGLAWFGPHLLDAGLSAYPRHLDRLTVGLAAILITQPVLAAIALLPPGRLRPRPQAA